MLRQAGHVARRPRASCFRRTGEPKVFKTRIHSSSNRTRTSAHSGSSSATSFGALGATVVTAAGAVALSLSYARARPVLNDAVPEVPAVQSRSSATPDLDLGGEHLTTIAWGSNRANLIFPTTPGIDIVRSPAAVGWLKDVALRDLALHERYGACVDARGDVYQWGDENRGDEGRWEGPVLSLRGKDIVSVKLAPSRIFALSSSGKIYVLSSAVLSEGAKIGENATSGSSFFSPLSWFSSETQNVDYIELGTEKSLVRGEKFLTISVGNDHVLALTSNGRTFAHPISKFANTYGQLGFRKITVPSQSSSTSGSRTPIELVPKVVADPFSSKSPNQRIQRITSSSTPPPLPTSTIATTSSGSESENAGTFFCDRLFEVPSLQGIKIAQAVAGARTSFVRTEEGGKVLAWGANENGQLGLGSTMTIDTITIPTEVVFSKSGTRSQCVDICAGGDLTFFTVERSDGSFIPTTDVLACGMGQWGGLGNGLYSTAQGNPLRVKAVSGLQEFSETTQNLQPIAPHALSVSPTGHVLLTLDTLSRAGPGSPQGGGRDLLVWGANRDYQLGNGKRASIATPTTLELPVSPGSASAGNGAEQGRLMLMKRRATEVRDLQGKKWKSGVEVEQCAVAGWGSSLVYWKICQK